MACQRNNYPVDCKSGSRVFKNEPSRSFSGENRVRGCAGSAEKAGSYADYSKMRSKREYGITIAEDGMKISFVFLSHTERRHRLSPSNRASGLSVRAGGV